MRSKADTFYGLPTVLVVLVKKSRKTCVNNGNMAKGNLLNATYAACMDSYYIYRTKKFESEGGQALLKKWGIVSLNLALGMEKGVFIQVKYITVYKKENIGTINKKILILGVSN